MRISPVGRICHQGTIKFGACPHCRCSLAIYLLIFTLNSGFSLLLSNGHKLFLKSLLNCETSQLRHACILRSILAEESVNASIFLAKLLSAGGLNNGLIEDLALPLLLLAGCGGVSVCLVQLLITTIKVVESLGLKGLVNPHACSMRLSLGGLLHSDIFTLLVAEDIRILVGSAENLCSEGLLVKQPVPRSQMHLLCSNLAGKGLFRHIHRG